MALGFKNRTRSQLRIFNRGIYLIGFLSGLVLFIYFYTFFNAGSINSADGNVKNKEQKIHGVEVENIISYYSFNKYPVLKADKGISAISVSKYASIKRGGIGNGAGLSAGNQSEDINLTYDLNPKLNSAGILVQFNFKKLDNSGVFFKRGKNFELSFTGNDLRIKYALFRENNTPIKVNERIGGVLPKEAEFVHVKFLYEPTLGLAVVQINGKNVWKNRTEQNLALNWESTKQFIFARKLSGAGEAEVIIDELIIASTTPPVELPFELLSFNCNTEDQIISIDWHTFKENETEYFIIEKSTDGKKFEEIGRTKAAGHSKELIHYNLNDQFPTKGVSFYRLMPSNSDIPPSLLPVIAINYQIDKTEAKR